MDEWTSNHQNMVLVMGLTGAGKTFFINELTGQNLDVGHGLGSCNVATEEFKQIADAQKGTARCQIVETSIGNTDFVIMDCPGFDDTTRSDAEILKVIAEQLAAVRLLGYHLKGIIYLHRITDNRMQGSALRNLDIFTKLVGKDALPNVVLATTMWGKVTDIKEANERDSELREEYWGDMRRRGSVATRFDGTKASAEGIVSQLLGKQPVVLKVQEQLVDQKLPLNQTAAGASIEPRIYDDEVQYRKRSKELEAQLQLERDSNTRLEIKRSQKQNLARLEKRMDDEKVMNSKPGEEVQSRLEKAKLGSKKIALSAIQLIAALCSITFGVTSFVLGGS